MRDHLRGLLPLLLLPLVIGAGGLQPAHAQQPPLDEAREIIQTFYDRLLECMKQGPELGLEGRRRKLAPALREAYDLPFMAAKVLGRHWRGLSDSGRARWVDVFERLTISTYAERFEAWDGELLLVEDAEAGSRDTIIVHTRIVPRDDEPVPIHYRMRARDGRVRVIDVFLNGTVSELALRRSEYGSFVERKGLDALIAELEAKIETGRASSEISSKLD